jgi:hypothetical protein
MIKRVIEIQPLCFEICQRIRQIEHFPFYFSPFFPVKETKLLLPIKNNFKLVLQQKTTTTTTTTPTTTTNTQLYFLHFLESYSHCLHSLSLLQKNGILYMKWSLDTVEFNETNTPILIDFRHAIFSDCNSLSLDKYLPFLPLDVHVWFFLKKTQKPSLSQLNMEEICQNYCKAFPPPFHKYVMEESMELLLNNQNIQQITTLTPSFQWDIHSMHLFFLWRMIDHPIHNYFLDIIFLKKEITIPFDCCVFLPYFTLN